MKKAQTPADVILVMVILFGLAIAGIVTTHWYNSFANSAMNMTAFNSSTQVTAAFKAGQTVNNMWDYLIMFLFIGSAIGLVIIGYFIDAHSIFLPIYIIGMILGVIVCGVLSYTWTELTNAGIYSVLKTSSFPLTDHLMGNLQIYFTIVAGLSMVATYAKSRSEAAI